MGSLAYTAAARSVWALARDRDNSHRRLLVPVKNNLAPDSTGLAFSIDRATMRIIWEPSPIHLHADQALSDDGSGGGGDRVELAKARKFLREFLCHRPARATEIYERAEEQGVAGRTLKRAKRAEGVDSYKNDDAWWWRYSKTDSSSVSCAIPADDGPLGPLGHVGPP
jgi:hypothetical protein